MKGVYSQLKMSGVSQLKRSPTEGRGARDPWELEWVWV